MSLFPTRCQGSCPLERMGDGGLGMVLMSERELQRIEVLSKVLERRMTVVSAAHVLDMTTCQVQRLLKAFRAEGAAALRHKARGRRSNHQLVLYFGPTFAAEKLAAEKLAERDGLRVRLAAQPIPHLSGNYVSVSGLAWRLATMRR